MDKKLNFTIRKANNSEDDLIARHFYQLWLDNNVSPDSIRADWQRDTIDFIVKARQNLSFQAFVATVEDRVIGSVSCQLFAGLYPTPFKSDFRHYGYIWNVYVEADYRRQGIATKLTKKAIAYLYTLNCTHAILHASPHGKRVYESLGFVPKNEMILELTAGN
ncbi:putative Acetyltransferase [Hyella patelloides LEGE 07179]|uniref:Putative Acetyltransferase n=1 Tax=Hyella patelloides LEGE 07179 TaxID=945734 RepID=A0A563VLB2_9CYAN|nr:GNAT family N-acetyltransferase [Hyella patelloides]VEP12202.1 putative Acetyltransferase [Hyella patelloides LEGE 07179]